MVVSLKQLASFPDLAILDAPNDDVSLAVSTGATIQALQLVDQQIEAISYAKLQTGFPGASEMISAVAAMKTAAGAWPDVKGTVVSAARAIVDAGPDVAALGAGDTTSASLGSELKGFASGRLATLKADFDDAKVAFDSFSTGMEEAYSASANANQDAASALGREQAHIDADIHRLQAKIKSLKSAGSILLGVITLGAATIAQIEGIERDVGSLKSEEQRHHAELTRYQASLAGFKGARDATKLASLALVTVRNGLQQAVNSIDDVTTQTSTDKTVMEAYLRSFKTDFAGAVAKAQRLLD